MYKCFVVNNVNKHLAGELASSGPSHRSKNSGIFRKMKKVLGLGLFRSKG